MVSDAVKWLTKWSAAHLSFAMQFTIHLSYLRSGKHTLCGIQGSCEYSKEKPQCHYVWGTKSVILYLLHREISNCQEQILFLRNSWKINGLCGAGRPRGSFQPKHKDAWHGSSCISSSQQINTHRAKPNPKQVGCQAIISCASDLWRQATPTRVCLEQCITLCCHYIRKPSLNANLNTEEVTLVTHHLFHRYLASFVWNGRDANPANFHPGTELTQTAADGIITSFPTFPGMSCLANLTVTLCPGLDEAHHEVLSRSEYDFSAIRGSTKGA